MRFHYDDQKTAQAAAYLLKLHGGRMEYMKLIKLLYLADREMLLATGQPITGDRLVSMKHGPVLSRVLDFITHGPEGTASAWFTYIGEPEHYAVSLRKEPELDELSRYEVRLLQSVHEQYGALNQWDLVSLLHKVLPEWKDPGDSVSEIRPESILRAEARSDEEIQRIENEAAETWFLGRAGS